MAENQFYTRYKPVLPHSLQRALGNSDNKTVPIISQIDSGSVN